MKFRLIAAAALAALAFAPVEDYVSIQKKLDLIDSERLKPGARINLTSRELNAWVAHEVPPGVRNTRLEVPTPGVATGSALVDFGKVRRAQGQAPGWLIGKLLDGERPVSVTAHITSEHGQATVDVQRVEVSGIEIDGATLDFLVQHVLLPMYPDAAVGRPFDLGHHVERLDIQPAAVGVIIGR